MQNFTWIILVNLISNKVHVNPIHCRSPFYFILYCFILKTNYILEGLVILNKSGVHDIWDFVPETEFGFASYWTQ